MSYQRSFENWTGETEYETVETPDEDYDRMKQIELDEALIPHHPGEDCPERAQVHRMAAFDPFVGIPGNTDQF